ncbi:hypothetical protein [Thermus scotoductus]|uniref:Uncharacterized protein n=1 Tax=Thermus scotoductus TaxID=37636 RepID=A0A430QZB6_THESC|nr:hypothetical protein [Thermus scotoductus]RTG93444.1 hypothetical protein CSW49_10735 [Thermus scotoductus]RTH00455.1 hypothetical protein CSW45_13555 [Thermus scotoductus]RTH16038.1 hypothetical protein CSW42_13840 [Thermus scotoductus]RTH96113.1 hypothetical protein CSW28_13875 [Thermus scotoductus]RTI17589.1 hypothetical protein CSW21_13245 [Thermus scotoductus]
MSPFLINLALNFLFGSKGKEVIDLAQRLILAAENAGGSGEEKFRAVMTALSQYAQEHGLLANFPQPLREAIFRLVIEALVFLLSKQGLINTHKRAYYEQPTFPWA